MQGARNARASVPANTAVSSTNSMPKRTSGLSEPKRSAASSQVIIAIGVDGRSPVAASVAAATASEMKPSTSSWSTNDASASSWVNSNWRSARRSSSRANRAIWKYRSAPPTISSCLNSCGLCGRA